jgi:anti-sigma B factor antagonist
MYEVTTSGRYAVVWLKGDVDLSCSPKARESLLSQINGGRPVLADLSGVTYMDSSGVASLVEGLQTAKKKGLSFGLVSVSKPVMSVLALARLDKVFAIYASAQDAPA